MESRKAVQMSLFAGQKQTQTQRMEAAGDDLGTGIDRPRPCVQQRAGGSC